MRKLLSSSLIVTVVGLCTLTAGPVFAQPGGGGGRGPGGFGMFGGGGRFGMNDVLEPSFNSRELTRVVKVLNLDKDQQEAAKLLFTSYEEQLREQSQPLRTKMERARDDFRENRDPSVWEGIRADTEKFRPTRDSLEKTFMTDLKGLLREDQAASWPRFERAVRREQNIGRGLMSGERVDLVRITDQAELSDETKAAIAPVIDLYEQDLDRELTARAAFMAANMSNMGELFMSGDTKKINEMIEKGRDLSVKVRDVNRRYARQVQDLVPEDKKAAIADAVKRESFPRVYNTTRATRMIDAAMKMTDLDDTQKQGLTALKDSYSRDLGDVNERLAAATEKMEMSLNAERMMTMWREMDQGEMGELNRKRGSLNRKTEEEVRKILTPAQADKLPKEEDDAEGRRRWNRDGAGADEADRPQRATPRRPRDNAGGGPS